MKTQFNQKEISKFIKINKNTKSTNLFRTLTPTKNCYIAVEFITESREFTEEQSMKLASIIIKSYKMAKE